MIMSEPTDPVLHALGKSSSELTFWAYRYFQGRMTAATCDFARRLARAWPHLEDHERNLIRKELEEAFRRDDEDRLQASETPGRPSILWLGHDCDRAAWETVREAWRAFDEEDEQ
jgi:hypothetical protein